MPPPSSPSLGVSPGYKNLSPRHPPFFFFAVEAPSIGPASPSCKVTGEPPVPPPPSFFLFGSASPSSDRPVASYVGAVIDRPSERSCAAIPAIAKPTSTADLVR
jgi:hypothetical protein